MKIEINFIIFIVKNNNLDEISRTLKKLLKYILISII